MGRTRNKKKRYTEKKVKNQKTNYWQTYWISEKTFFEPDNWNVEYHCFQTDEILSSIRTYFCLITNQSDKCRITGMLDDWDVEKLPCIDCLLIKGMLNDWGVDVMVRQIVTKEKLS